MIKLPFQKLVETGERIIDKIVPDADKRLQYKQQLSKMDEQELQNSFANIQAEIKSEDKFVSRARPTFLYIMYLFILMSIPVSVLGLYYPTEVKTALTSMNQYLESLPGDLYTLFTIGFLGYAGMRSYDKAKATRK